jgi:pimeloyl-ACP methyl ester carboxylesterase
MTIEHHGLCVPELRPGRWLGLLTRRLTLPVLAIGGAEGIGEGAATTMKLAADDVRSLIIPGSGHYCLEEAPEEVAAALTAFLAPHRG